MNEPQSDVQTLTGTGMPQEGYWSPVTVLCGPCLTLECAGCKQVVEDGGLKVACACAEAGHEHGQDEDDDPWWQHYD